MKNILVVGGPHHGQETPDEGPLWSPLVMMQDTNNPGAPAVAMPTRYIKRHLDGQFGDVKKRKEVYTHESIQNPQQLTAFLSNYLIGKWLEDGGEIVEGETSEMVPGGPEGRADDMGQQPPRSASGLYIPG